MFEQVLSALVGGVALQVTAPDGPQRPKYREVDRRVEDTPRRFYNAANRGNGFRSKSPVQPWRHIRGGHAKTQRVIIRETLIDYNKYDANGNKRTAA